MSDCIQLAHGGGGTLMQQLINQELRALYADPARSLSAPTATWCSRWNFPVGISAAWR